MNMTNLRKSLFAAGLAIFTFLSLGAQDSKVTVRGRVQDSVTGDPLPGATVLEVGTDNVALTDADGRFSILTDRGGAA